jgi:hypothetical protein
MVTAQDYDRDKVFKASGNILESPPGGAAPKLAPVPGASQQPQLPAPQSEADYNRLPSGARYLYPGDPPGHYRTKP